MTAAVARAGRREWTGLAVIALSCLLYSMDLTVLNLAVPALSADLAPSATQLLWILDIYGFTVAGFLIPMGLLGDRYGRRRLMLWGAAAFGVASAFAAFAPTAGWLIVWRFVLGVAGATLAPSTLSLIRHLFHDPDQRRMAIGIWVTAYSVGSAMGPVVGGVLLDYFWWGSVFLIGVPVMVLLLVVGPVLLPEFRDPDAGRLDVASVALSLCAVLLAIYGVKRWAAEGFGALPFAAVVAGVALGAGFVQRQRTLAQPLIDLRLFRAPGFGAALLVYALAGFVLLGGFVLLSQHLQLVMGLTPLEAGLWGVPFSAVIIVGSMATPRLARRFTPGRVMAAGLLVASAGYALLAPIETQWSIYRVAGAYVVYAIGFSPVFTLATDIVVGTASPERAGVAAALSETGIEFGGALGIALLGSVAMAVYRLSLEAAALPGVPAEAIGAASGTLGGALAAAQALPGELGAPLMQAARDAFVRGERVVLWIAVAVTAATAWVAWRKIVDPPQR